MIRSNKGKVTLDGTGEEILADLGSAVIATYEALYGAAREDEKDTVEECITETLAKGIIFGKKKAIKSREKDLDPEIKKAIRQAAKELIQILEDKEDHE
jgi:ABC-type enterochelin transport system substrate-binding protein